MTKAKGKATKMKVKKTRTSLQIPTTITKTIAVNNKTRMILMTVMIKNKQEVETMQVIKSQRPNPRYTLCLMP